jgi:hypothetical protein
MESMSPALLKVEAVKGNSTQILATIVRKNQVYKHHPILRYSSPKRTLKLIFALTVITDGTSMKKPPPRDMEAVVCKPRQEIWKLLMTETSRSQEMAEREFSWLLLSTI